MLETDYPGRTFVVIPVGGPSVLQPGLAAGIAPDYQKFDRVLKTQVRPVLVSLQRAPFRDFTTEEFLGSDFFTCRLMALCRSLPRVGLRLSAQRFIASSRMPIFHSRRLVAQRGPKSLIHRRVGQCHSSGS